MKKILLALVVLGSWFLYQEYFEARTTGPAVPDAASRPAEVPATRWQAGQQVRGKGVVSRILPDDNEGSRHQRFILRLESGRTLLVAHNIDLAPRIATIRVGDKVAFYGEYEPNERGGVIHWTHHDPQGRHPAGWLEHEGRRYQ